MKSQSVLERDIDRAISWARSQCLVARQEKSRRTREQKKTTLKGNDAVEAMFAAVGCAPDEILKK
jgi:hypothetical protein